ncbi:MAG: hypothetical protein IKP72_16050 [Clostridia bacterium]|nr:hypothetical protein [Clostridia bacterium]
MGKKLTEDQIRKIKALHGMGMNDRQIGEFLGLARTTCYAVNSGKREAYNQVSRENMRKRRTQEQAVHLAIETPEEPRRLADDPCHVITGDDVRAAILAAIGDTIKAEKKNAWGMIYSAVRQAIQDTQKGGGADGDPLQDV